MKFPEVYVILYTNTRGEVRAQIETYTHAKYAQTEGALIFKNTRTNWFVGKVVDK